MADVEEATEQRKHSVADLIPQSEQIHDSADRLSGIAEKHRRRVQRRRDDDDERDDSRPIQRRSPENPPIFEQITAYNLDFSPLLRATGS